MKVIHNGQVVKAHFVGKPWTDEYLILPDGTVKHISELEYVREGNTESNLGVSTGQEDNGVAE